MSLLNAIICKGVANIRRSDINDKKRQSNFELLRVIAMMMVIIHHSMIHGTLDVSRTTISQGNQYSLALFCMLAFGGKVGVCVFSLITGYFMLYSHISVRKLVKLWLPIFFGL